MEGPRVSLLGIYGVAEGGHEDSSFRHPSSLISDFEGNLVVADTGNHRIVKLTPDGTCAWAVGGQDFEGNPRNGTAQSEFDRPQALATDTENNIYVADSRNCRVQKFSAEGDFLTVFGSRRSANGQFRGDGPLGQALGKNGRILVGDSHTAAGGNHRVQVFTPDGDYLYQFGSYGTGPDQFGGAAPIRQYGFDHGPGIGPGPIGPAALAVKTQPAHLLEQNVQGGSIYVADCDNDRIIAFRGRGVPSLHIGVGLIFRPRQAALDRAGRIYVSGVHMHEPPLQVYDLNQPGKWRVEPECSWVWIFSPAGDPLGRIGLTATHELMEHHPKAGLHAHGYGLAVNRVDDSNLYVQDDNLIFSYKVEW